MSARVVSTDVAVGGSTASFLSTGGVSSIVAGAATFLYSIAFVVLKAPTLYSLLQLV
ncbi:MAG: hypothetical protein QOH93_3351, partial [Chloroflexia bacterium]|nr:hypothetical protein [Chloroflexia bacterium]